MYPCNKSGTQSLLADCTKVLLQLNVASTKMAAAQTVSLPAARLPGMVEAYGD